MGYAFTSTPPSTTAAPALTGTAPSVKAPAALSNTGPDSTDQAPALSGAAPSTKAAPALSTTPPQPLDLINGGSVAVPDMPSTFTPAFIELTGSGPVLASLTANAADAAGGKILTGTVGGVLKNYQVRVGTDAQALPGVVRPANFNAETNAVVFVACG